MAHNGPQCNGQDLHELDERNKVRQFRRLSNVVQQWWAMHEAAAEHLYLAEPFPPGRMPSGGAVEEYPRII